MPKRRRMGFFGKEFIEAGIFKDKKKAKKLEKELLLQGCDVELSFQDSGPGFSIREHIVYSRKKKLGGLW